MINNLKLDIEVSKEQIISILQINRQNHIKDYEDAIKVYFSDLEQLYLENLNKISKKLDINYNINIIKPQNKQEEYDKIISMFERSLNNTFLLSNHDYSKIFDDDWDWIKNTKLLNSSYSSRLN